VAADEPAAASVPVVTPRSNGELFHQPTLDAHGMAAAAAIGNSTSEGSSVGLSLHAVANGKQQGPAEGVAAAAGAAGDADGDDKGFAGFKISSVPLSRMYPPSKATRQGAQDLEAALVPSSDPAAESAEPIRGSSCRRRAGARCSGCQLGCGGTSGQTPRQ